MPTVTLTWDDINDNEDGFNIYRSTTPLDTANPANLPTPLATVAAGIGTYDDTTAAADTTYYYAVAAIKGTFVNAAADVQVSTAAATGPDFSTAQVGDEIGGGIYAGTHGNGTETWHLIFAKQAGEGTGLAWGNVGSSTSDTTGADDPDDGYANQQLILTSFDDGSADAFYHCRDYIDGAGNDDYYFPSQNEILLIKPLFDSGHPEFSLNASEYRSTSTETAHNTCVLYRASDGNTITGGGKGFAATVRPARRVPV